MCECVRKVCLGSYPNKWIRTRKRNQREPFQNLRGDFAAFFRGGGVGESFSSSASSRRQAGEGALYLVTCIERDCYCRAGTRHRKDHEWRR